MRKLSYLSLWLVLFSTTTVAQLSDHPLNGSFTFGIYGSGSSIKDASILYQPRQKIGPFFGFSVDMAVTNYSSGSLRYQLQMPIINDLLHQVGKLVKWLDEGEVLDLTGYTWHKIGYNVFSNGKICVGFGASLADYYLDLPYLNAAGDNFTGASYSEPSGWNWTA